MKLVEFLSLGYKDQLAQLSRFGSLKTVFTLAGYQFSLYQIHDFFVELKRRQPDLHFEKMMTMRFEELPNEYKLLFQPAPQY